MSGGKQRFDRERPDMKVDVFLESFRSGDREGFEFTHPDFPLRFSSQLRQISDMIVVAMRDENIAQSETLGVQNVQHTLASGARVERRGYLGSGIPDEVAIHGHVIERGVERSETSGEVRLLRIPSFVRQGLECLGGESQVTSHPPGNGIDCFPCLHCRQIRR
jgi:hypothetical protein